MTEPWWEVGIIVLLAVFGGYMLLWAVPGTLCGVVLSLGDPQRIVYIDKQLSKDVKKLHAKPMCMLSASIMSRYVDYCISYPFIRHRVTTESKKFRAFMWFNSLGFWSFIISGVLTLVVRILDILPHS
ncbi:MULTISPECIES: hypothetical protein [unclassified Vibrio]|uniref:hypothetical protein n=1 Tax=unclassified Vibrio TaxID=2614977 RepID=UPI0013618167|nr:MULTISPECIES: hypothetical protein [unclassified Vibrio]NAW59326.1 hypothetical protein [Vibrio sp. V36_P2S2PM302]NAX25008.1 hypothetical protein [Vibrio sp. V38_P2S17PM301]NAX29205.1 hypothetical protein [Vibrio sp. V37_P2S8PM304]